VVLRERVGHLGHGRHDHEIVKELEPRGVPFLALLRRPQAGPNEEGRAEYGKEFRRLHRSRTIENAASFAVHEKTGADLCHDFIVARPKRNAKPPCDAWNTLKTGIEAARKDLKEAVSAARDKFKKTA
jgi:hypothetical protein